MRLALGASRRHLTGLVLTEGLAAPLAGLAIGLAAAYIAAPQVQPMRFATEARAFVTFVGVSLAIGLVSLLACVGQIRRATTTPPIVAMRGDG